MSRSTARSFILFGISMGVILSACTVAIAWLGDGLIKRARALGPHLGWLSAVVLWIAGGLRHVLLADRDQASLSACS
jgi:hypothetical protein